jgi:hypothetical protein
MSVSPQIQTSIAVYLDMLSAWRKSKFADDLHDQRNLQSADGLLELKRYVIELPDDDQRLRIFTKVAMDGSIFAPGQQASYELGRFRFHDKTATCDGFLTKVAELSLEDAGESGRFGGPQVAGDEPW